MNQHERKAHICQVRYHTAGKLQECRHSGLELKACDRILVDLEPGQCLASVASTQVPTPGKGPSKRIMRLANEEDLAREQRNRERAEEAYRFCQRRIESRGLPMQLVKVEYLFDGSKAIFYFTAEGRVDFRELVKDLTREINTRVEMRQIGVRDAAKKLGGYGPCGLELCCSTWLVDFSPVSVRMAKDQNLSLNPSKLSGLCGRLKCCLAYEHETYARMKTLLPRTGSQHKSEQGTGKVIKSDVLKLSFTVAYENGYQEEIRIPEPEVLPPAPVSTRVKPGQRPKKGSRTQNENKSLEADGVLEPGSPEAPTGAENASPAGLADEPGESSSEPSED